MWKSRKGRKNLSTQQIVCVVLDKGMGVRTKVVSE